MEPDPAGEIQPHDADHVLDLERMGEERMAHVMPGRVVQLGLLQMKLRLGKAVEGADVVVVHVGQDHVGDRVAVEPDHRQRLGRAAQMPPAARGGDLGGKAGVDHKAALGPDRRPDEIIHRHRPVMRVAADEMVAAARVALGIADRIELVFGKIRHP